MDAKQAVVDTQELSVQAPPPPYVQLAQQTQAAVQQQQPPVAPPGQPAPPADPTVPPGQPQAPQPPQGWVGDPLAPDGMGPVTGQVPPEQADLSLPTSADPALTPPKLGSALRQSLQDWLAWAVKVGGISTVEDAGQQATPLPQDPADTVNTPESIPTGPVEDRDNVLSKDATEDDEGGGTSQDTPGSVLGDPDTPALDRTDDVSLDDIAEATADPEPEEDAKEASLIQQVHNVLGTPASADLRPSAVQAEPEEDYAGMGRTHHDGMPASLHTKEGTGEDGYGHAGHMVPLYPDGHAALGMPQPLHAAHPLSVLSDTDAPDVEADLEGYVPPLASDSAVEHALDAHEADAWDGGGYGGDGGTDKVGGVRSPMLRPSAPGHTKWSAVQPGGVGLIRIPSTIPTHRPVPQTGVTKFSSTALTRRILSGALSPQTIQRAAGGMADGAFRTLGNLGRGQFNLVDRVVGNVGGTAGVMARRLPTQALDGMQTAYGGVKRMTDQLNQQYRPGLLSRATAWMQGKPAPDVPIAPMVGITNKGGFQQLATGNVPHVPAGLRRRITDLHAGNFGPNGQILDYAPANMSQAQIGRMWNQPRIDPLSDMPGGSGRDLFGNVGSNSGLTSNVRKILEARLPQSNNLIRKYWAQQTPSGRDNLWSRWRAGAADKRRELWGQIGSSELHSPRPALIPRTNSWSPAMTEGLEAVKAGSFGVHKLEQDQAPQTNRFPEMVGSPAPRPQPAIQTPSSKLQLAQNPFAGQKRAAGPLDWLQGQFGSKPIQPARAPQAPPETLQNYSPQQLQQLRQQQLQPYHQELQRRMRIGTEQGFDPQYMHDSRGISDTGVLPATEKLSGLRSGLYGLGRKLTGAGRAISPRRNPAGFAGFNDAAATGAGGLGAMALAAHAAGAIHPSLHPLAGALESAPALAAMVPTAIGGGYLGRGLASTTELSKLPGLLTSELFRRTGAALSRDMGHIAKQSGALSDIVAALRKAKAGLQTSGAKLTGAGKALEGPVGQLGGSAVGGLAGAGLADLTARTFRGALGQKQPQHGLFGPSDVTPSAIPGAIAGTLAGGKLTKPVSRGLQGVGGLLTKLFGKVGMVSCCGEGNFKYKAAPMSYNQDVDLSDVHRKTRVDSVVGPKGDSSSIFDTKQAGAIGLVLQRLQAALEPGSQGVQKGFKALTALQPTKQAADNNRFAKGVLGAGAGLAAGYGLSRVGGKQILRHLMTKAREARGLGIAKGLQDYVPLLRQPQIARAGEQLAGVGYRSNWQHLMDEFKSRGAAESPDLFRGLGTLKELGSTRKYVPMVSQQGADAWRARMPEMAQGAKDLRDKLTAGLGLGGAAVGGYLGGKQGADNFYLSRKSASFLDGMETSLRQLGCSPQEIAHLTKQAAADPLVKEALPVKALWRGATQVMPKVFSFGRAAAKSPIQSAMPPAQQLAYQFGNVGRMGNAAHQAGRFIGGAERLGANAWKAIPQPARNLAHTAGGYLMGGGLGAGADYLADQVGIDTHGLGAQIGGFAGAASRAPIVSKLLAGNRTANRVMSGVRNFTSFSPKGLGGVGSKVHSALGWAPIAGPAIGMGVDHMVQNRLENLSQQHGFENFGQASDLIQSMNNGEVWPLVKHVWSRMPDDRKLALLAGGGSLLAGTLGGATGTTGGIGTAGLMGAGALGLGYGSGMFDGGGGATPAPNAAGGAQAAPGQPTGPEAQSGLGGFLGRFLPRRNEFAAQTHQPQPQAV